MGFFSRNKKTEAASCCCGGSCTPEAMAQAEAGKATVGVKVLGSGCAKCNALEQAVQLSQGLMDCLCQMQCFGAGSP